MMCSPLVLLALILTLLENAQAQCNVCPPAQVDSSEPGSSCPSAQVPSCCLQFASSCDCRLLTQFVVDPAIPVELDLCAARGPTDCCHSCSCSGDPHVSCLAMALMMCTDTCSVWIGLVWWWIGLCVTLVGRIATSLVPTTNSDAAVRRTWGRSAC